MKDIRIWLLMLLIFLTNYSCGILVKNQNEKIKELENIIIKQEKTIQELNAKVEKSIKLSKSIEGIFQHD